MHISRFDFELPDELIAQQPLENRAESRMLAVDRKGGKFSDRRFSEFPEFINEGDVVVLNDTKVIPARLFGRTESGANVEIFLIKEVGDKIWTTLARPARRLRPGKHIVFDRSLEASVERKSDDGTVTVRFEFEGAFDAVLDEVGTTPLPPYIRRENSSRDSDRERYQTVYAKKRGAIAAPTAGLHFSPKILDAVRKRGAQLVEITLHIGYGTFEPVRVEDLSQHSVLPERYEINDASARMLNRAMSEKRRIIAVGTTTTRALESAIAANGKFIAGNAVAGLTITPGFRFRCVDALLTNFHLPKSSLLVLISTFGGHDLIMDAYKHAVTEGYRFYSYGDCMFIY